MTFIQKNLEDNLANSESFKSKVKITGSTPADGNTKDVKIIVILNYLSKFWRTLEMPLINCEVSLFKHGHQLVLLLILQAKKDLQ